jgi:hypothetical protein
MRDLRRIAADVAHPLAVLPDLDVAGIAIHDPDDAAPQRASGVRPVPTHASRKSVQRVADAKSSSR